MLGHMIDHRIKDQPGMTVILIFDTPQDFPDIIGAEMGIEPCLTSNTLEQLFLSIAPTETETYEVGSRQ